MSIAESLHVLSKVNVSIDVIGGLLGISLEH